MPKAGGDFGGKSTSTNVKRRDPQVPVAKKSKESGSLTEPANGPR